jgi:hypothetical protein
VSFAPDRFGAILKSVQEPTAGTVAIRASDAEREQLARSLGAHLAAGRLTLEEFSARVEQAYRAVTVGELQALAADLPRPTPEAAPLEGSRRPFWPGNVPFAIRIWTPASADAVVRAAMRTVAPRFLAQGFQLERSGPTLIVFSRTRRPAWTIAVAVLVFPIGLLALLRQERSQVVISVDDSGDETIIDVSGQAGLGVRRAVRVLALPG